MLLFSEEVEITINNRFADIGICTHGQPGYTDILCIDFSNHGDASLPELLRHAILVPDVIENPPHLGNDRSLYRIPANHDAVIITLESGPVGPKTLFTAFIQTSWQGALGDIISHTICAVDT